MNKEILNKIKFFSLLAFGIFAFLIPFSLPVPGLEKKTILISHFSSFILTNFKTQFIIFTIIVQFLILATVIIAIYKRCKKFTFKHKFLNDLTETGIPINLMKISGALFFLLIAFNELGFSINFEHLGFLKQFKPVYEMIINPDTGGTTFGLVLSLFLTFFIGNALLPIITDFGAVEFIGNLVSKFMTKLFKIPGYSAIDAIASFVGDGTIGILVTDKQYQKGYYTQRQAGIIASSFSIVGIAFATLVAEQLNLANHFFIFYGTIILITLIIAFIFARVNFFHFKDTYYDENHVQPPAENATFSEALAKGINVCSHANVKEIILTACRQIVLTYIVFVPTIMCVGTIGLIIATYSDIFQIISLPFVNILEFFGFGESSQAMAPGLFIGFIDMYLPTLFVSDPGLVISSAAKFFIGVLSFSQLVFLSETGMIFLNTKIGFKFFDIVKLFLIRTILSIPILLVITYLLSYFSILSF